MSAKRVLVVDDDPAFRHVMEIALRKQGYVVSTSHDGKEGETRIRSERPDLVVLDVMMPGKTGLDICQDLKCDPAFSSLPILMLTHLTWDSEAGDDIWRDNTGADDFMTKPFPIGEFVRRVKQLIGEPAGA